MKSSSFGESRFVKTLPQNLDFQSSILIFDSVLQKKYSRWIKKFPRRLRVRSGESLKDIKNFPGLMQKIVEQASGLPRKKISIVAFGGGSVGDFAGFAASVLKRGVNLIQVPSTWLAAMDSAHGGKTALNVGQIKNQIGSFKFPLRTYLVKDLLLKVPEKQIQDSLGEFYKMAFIVGGSLWKSAAKNQESPKAKFLWQHLPKVIHGKMRIVSKDPFESKGLRQKLNLGHTVGHILEAELGIPHGQAVILGLRFSLNWGTKLGYFHFPESSKILPEQKILAKRLWQIKNIEQKLLQDKKLVEKKHIDFIFVKKPGSVFIKTVKISELTKEWSRQCR